MIPGGQINKSSAQRRRASLSPFLIKTERIAFMTTLQMEIESLEIDIEELEKKIKLKCDLLETKKKLLYNPVSPLEILSESVPLNLFPRDTRHTILAYQNKVKNKRKYGL